MTTTPSKQSPWRARLSRVRSRREPDAPPQRPTLDEIGLRTGTDKSSTLHDFLRVYDRELGHLRDREITMIEIGVHQGSSLRMWEEYFSRGRIVGVDLDPACKRFENERVTVRVGNQGDRAFIQKLGTKYRPTVVVDDGSHRWQHQIDTLRDLWPAVRPGGMFIVEDIHTSFGEDYARTYGTPDGETAYDFVAGLVRSLVAADRADPPADDFEAYFRNTVDSAVMLGRSVVLRKRSHRQPWYRRASVADVTSDPWITDVGAPYERIPAELVDASPAVDAAFRSLTGSGPVAFEPAASAEFTDVLVHGFGPAATKDRKILAETLNCAQNIRRSSNLYRPFGEDRWVVERDVPRRRVPAPEEGRHLVLLKQTWDRNYGHWLVDALPKVGLLDGFVDRAACTYVVNVQTSDAMRQVVLDSLALAGIGEDQVMFTEVGALSFERIIVPGTIARHPVRKSPFAIRFLEDLASTVEPGTDRRLYVSRNGYSRRRLLNEEAVLARLADFGYEMVEPEKLTLREQIAAFSGADSIVGNMGAAFTNLVFSPQQVSVLALATETMKHDYFYDLVCHKQGRYRGLQGTADRSTGQAPDIGSDFVVDLDSLEECLAWLHPEG
ncbi:glycosyltransferase 61 family protein [Aeromicrobium sp. IC_218]|uniref:glycosyltransferase 61 family protein n=1 Tax=Aeromicrobium sp. IC_218 TaxID=2545468 RepID=UPI0013F47087|nr:glycosyltransferase 61 family protein [Aeromicrobium sp. IC_218]